MTRSAVAFALAVGMSVCLAAHARADGEVVTGEPQPAHRGEWKYEPCTSFDESLKLTPEELAAFNKNLLLVAETVHAVTSVNPPVGFLAEVRAEISSCSSEELTRALPLAGAVRVSLTPYVKNEQGVVPGYGQGNGFTVEVNRPEDVVNPGSLEESLADEGGARFYWAPTAAGAVQGFPLYASGHLLLARPGREPYVPVTREHLLLGIIRQAEKMLADTRAGQAKMAASDPLAEWMAGAEERRKTQAETLAAIQKMNPAMADQMKAQWAKMELEMPIGLKKMQAETQAALKDDRMTSMLGKRVAALRKELQAMPPAQRAEPAWWLGMGDDMQKSGLAPAKAEGARAVVRVNPAWFDKALPRTALQLVTVRTELPVDPEEFAALEQLTAEADFVKYHHYRLFKNVDWAKVAALLGK